MNKLVLSILALLCLRVVSFGQNNADDFSALFNAVKSAVRATEKEIYLQRMLQSDAGIQSNNQFLLDATIQMVSSAFADEKAFEKALEWSGKIKDQQMRLGANMILAQNLIGDSKFREAHQILGEQVAEIKKDINGDIVPTQDQLQPALIFGELCYAEGNFDQAAHYLQAAIEISKYVDKYKELYILALIKYRTGNAIEEDIKKVFLAEGKRSDQFKNEVKVWYIKNDGNTNRFDVLEKQASKENEALLAAKVAKMAVDKSAPAFEIKDVNGVSVSLASLRGKTVILDFWATWCQPCVASFPGMKKAVNYFKNDPTVVFMFIHTAEKKGAQVKEQALALINDKQYPFDIYLDIRDPSTGKSPVAKVFGVTSIPAKFVINKQGVIKYATTGYVSEDEAIDEIKLMVNQANK